MTKYLKPITIIPQELYVSRNADKQIKELIDYMGRPGYILVSRQMGKTNLLINAKRNLESDIDIITYIDLSNKFESARDCFRNIIDTIIETNLELLEDAMLDILTRRDKMKLSEHKEHSYELRRLLKNIKGKLVISLDEIDSLTQANYSDKIFAQIRSVYFDRVNFNEFNRLTYILSGVAEPSDIIKDSSISPFNIGQKIFLGDFTKTEYKELLVKSNITLDIDVEDRIFYWTNGNPRLTWEICSEMEDLINSGDKVNVSDVDDVVNIRYLKNFDRPPIDHIRILISKDIKLRDAIVAIKYGKTDVITDDVKSKLYLAGVLDSNYEEGQVKIKNRIIDLSLDDDWLDSLGQLESLSVGDADSLYSNQEYSIAIKQYEELLNNVDNLTFIEENQIHYKLAASFHHTQEYSKVIECCDACRFTLSANKSIFLELLWLKGSSYEKLGENEKAIKCYSEIIDLEHDNKSEIYFRSILDTIVMNISSSDENKYESTTQLFSDLFSDISIEKDNVNSTLKSNQISYFLALAYFTQGIFKLEVKNFNEARKSFESSLHYADDDAKLFPALELLKLVSKLGLDVNISNLYFDTIVDLVSDKDRLIPFYSTDFTITGTLVRDIIAFSVKIFDCDKVEFLINVLSENIKVKDYNFNSLIMEVADDFMKSNDHKRTLLLLNYIFSVDRKKVDPEEYFDASKMISYLDPGNDEARDVYFKGFQNYIKTSDNIDLLIFEKEIMRLREMDDHIKATALCNIILNSDGSIKGDISSRMLPIFFLKMLCEHSSEERLRMAYMLKEKLSETPPSEYKYARLDKKLVKHFEINANQIISELSLVEQVTYTEKRYGRNEKVRVKYPDGRVMNKKFKQVESQVKKGECIIV